MLMDSLSIKSVITLLTLYCSWQYM